MATIRQSGEQYVYDDNGFEIPLSQENFVGFHHRLGEFALMDLVTVEDPRDGLKFTHWRYNQPEGIVDRMLELTAQIGRYIIHDSPFEDVENIFYNAFGPKDEEIDQLLGGSDV
jgi:hypothetical protein